MISEVLLLEYLIVNLRPWIFFISQKPNPTIVLLYIERILSFSLRHKMHVFKVCSNSFFISSGSLSFFLIHVTVANSFFATFVDLFVFCECLSSTILTCNEENLEVMFSLLHWRLATQSARTWHDYLWKHAPRSYMTWLPVSQVLISKIHCTLSANQKRDSEFNV